MPFLVILGLLLFVLAAFLVWKRRAYHRRMNLLRRAVPTRAAEIERSYPGEIVALSGTARPQRPLLSEQTKTPCIYFDYRIERRYEERRGLLSPGRNRRRRQRRRGREVVTRHRQSVPFTLEDSSGVALVAPEGAEFDARTVLNRYQPKRSQANALGIPGLDIDLSLGGSKRTLGHQFVERVIPADSPVFVAGVVDEHGQIGPGRGDDNTMIVSHRRDSALREEWGTRERRFLLGAAAAAGLGMLIWFIAGVQWIVSLV